MWEVKTVQKPNITENHTLPVGDSKPHQETKRCVCKPSVENYGKSILICHNSFDGREFFEPDNLDLAN